MIFSDFHVHTAHDHGRAMPAEMAAEAARMNMKALGMVGHAQMEFECEYHPDKGIADNYIELLYGFIQATDEKE